MDWPGEKLLIKLWESLAEKGIGSLLKPWQIRREGQANVDVRRYEMLALAEAERDCVEIRSGKCSLENGKYVLSLTEKSSAAGDQPESRDVPLLDIASRTAITDAMRKEINVAKAVLHAEEELRDDQAPPADQKLDDDWMYRWRDYAGSVSSEELQAIWGRILAGEIKSPGLYSYRLLDFVRNLTKDEANLIERIAPFVLRDFIVRDHDAILEAAGVSFDILLELQNLGILSGVDALGLSKTLRSGSKEQYISALTCHGRGLLVKNDNASKTFDLGVCILTNLGKQVIKLGKFTPNEKYLLAVGKQIQKAGFKVSLIDYENLGNGMIRCSNEDEIPNAAQGAGGSPEEPGTSD